MTQEEFERRMWELFPTLSKQAMTAWLEYAASLDADCTISEDDFFARTYVAFSLTAEHHGEGIAQALFDYGEHFTWNPFGIQGAATMAAKDIPLNEIQEQVLLNGCDCTPEEAQESRAALEQLLAGEESGPSMTFSGP